jgi:hypothetical protein
MHGEPTRPRLELADALVALLLALLGAAAARASFQERMLGDGAGLATFYARGDRLAYHFLFLPFCRLLAPLARWTAPGDPIEAARLASAAALGLGAGFSFLLARELGAPRPGALAAALLLALAPAALFFGTTVEVHALHLAASAGCAWLVLRLPWSRPALSTALAALLYGLVFWAHQLGVLLGPGWIALCALGARRAGRPLSTRALLLLVGPCLLLGIALASALANRLRYGAFWPSAEHELRILSDFSRPAEAWRFGWNGWLRGLALLLPAAAVGLARGTFARGERAALLLLILFPTAFLFAWGVSERGGYALGHAAFLAALAARAFPRAPWPAALAAAPLLLAQGLLGVRDVLTFGRGFDINDRVRLVAEHLDGGTFLSTVDNAPSITIYLPGATEINGGDVLLGAKRAGLTPGQTVDILLDHAREELARTGRLLVDLGFDTQRERAPIAARLPVLDPLVLALHDEFRTTTIEDPCWPLLIVER